jgi:hypothetical protein
LNNIYLAITKKMLAPQKIKNYIYDETSEQKFITPC